MKKHKKQLQLTRETVKSLTASQLHDAVGGESGGGGSCTCTNNTCVNHICYRD